MTCIESRLYSICGQKPTEGGSETASKSRDSGLCGARTHITASSTTQDRIQTCMDYETRRARPIRKEKRKEKDKWEAFRWEQMTPVEKEEQPEPERVIEQVKQRKGDA